MTTPQQIEANRLNAAKCTGPRTEAGKAAAALNALRHGLLARELLVKGESAEDLTAFAEGVRARLAPVGELEIFVVNRVIAAAWRLRRAVAVETAFFSTENAPDGAAQDRLGKMRLLSRYEVTLERSLYQALDQLQTLQHRRQEYEWRHPEESDPEIGDSDSETGVSDRELGSFRKIEAD